MENLNDSKTLAIEIAKILDKKKAQDVRVLKVESLTVLTDYFVIASGTSTTQVAALADEVDLNSPRRASILTAPRALTPRTGFCWIIPTSLSMSLFPTPAPITIWSTCGPMASPSIFRSI